MQSVPTACSFVNPRELKFYPSILFAYQDNSKKESSNNRIAVSQTDIITVVLLFDIVLHKELFIYFVNFREMNYISDEICI